MPAGKARVMDGVGDGDPAVPMLASWPMPLMRPDGASLGTFPRFLRRPVGACASVGVVRDQPSGVSTRPIHLSVIGILRIDFGREHAVADVVTPDS